MCRRDSPRRSRAEPRPPKIHQEEPEEEIGQEDAGEDVEVLEPQAQSWRSVVLTDEQIKTIKTIAPILYSFFKAKKDNIDKEYSNLSEQIELIDSLIKIEGKSMEEEYKFYKDQQELLWNVTSPVMLTTRGLISSLNKQNDLLYKQIELYHKFLAAFTKFLKDYSMIPDELDKITNKIEKTLSEKELKKENQDYSGVVEKLKELKDKPLEEIEKELEKIQPRWWLPLEIQKLDFFPYRPALTSLDELKKLLEAPNFDSNLEEENQFVNVVYKEIKQEQYESFRKRLSQLTEREPDFNLWIKRLKAEMSIYFTIGDSERREIIRSIFSELRKTLGKLEDRVKIVREVFK